MKDLVNKWKVMEILASKQDGNKDTYNILAEAIMDVLNIPEEEPGEWIDVDLNGTPFQGCSKCHTIFPLAYTGGGHNFCPQCGSRMKCEQQELVPVEGEES